MDKHFFEFLLRMGDTTLILSQRLGEWTGHGPILEEDLALTNTALDLLGQARMWLTLAGEVEGAGRDEDALAYLRDAHQFHNALLVERANGNYADTMARQFLFDVWHYFLLQKLERSADERVAAIAAKALKEVTYHVRRSSDMVVRLGDGTAESHAKMQAAIDDAWRFTGELFFDDAVDQDLAARGIGCLLSELREPWARHVAEVLGEATLSVPDAAAASHPAHRGGRQAGTARNWATCWPRCNSCRAPIREPSGERHGARVRRPGLRLAAGSAGSGDPRAFRGGPGRGARRALGRRDLRGRDHAHLFGLSGHARDHAGHRGHAGAARRRRRARRDPPGAGLDHRLDERRAAPRSRATASPRPPSAPSTSPASAAAAPRPPSSARAAARATRAWSAISAPRRARRCTAASPAASLSIISRPTEWLRQ